MSRSRCVRGAAGVVWRQRRPVLRHPDGGRVSGGGPHPGGGTVPGQDEGLHAAQPERHVGPAGRVAQSEIPV